MHVRQCRSRETRWRKALFRELSFMTRCVTWSTVLTRLGKFDFRERFSAPNCLTPSSGNWDMTRFLYFAWRYPSQSLESPTDGLQTYCNRRIDMCSHMLRASRTPRTLTRMIVFKNGYINKLLLYSNVDRIYTVLESIFPDLELYKEHEGLSCEIKSGRILISCLPEIDKPILSHKVVVTKISLWRREGENT